MVPFKSRRERVRWMTPAEAIAHVCRAKGCGRREAKGQLVSALKENALPWEWTAKHCGCVHAGMDWRPGPLWQKNYLRNRNGGEVRCTDDGYRAFLVLREVVELLWPELTPAKPAAEAATAETAKTAPETESKLTAEMAPVGDHRNNGGSLYHKVAAMLDGLSPEEAAQFKSAVSFKEEVHRLKELWERTYPKEAISVSTLYNSVRTWREVQKARG